MENLLTNVIFHNETTNAFEDKSDNNCILFILSNSPNIGSILHKYISFGFQFKNILIYSKKYSIVKSYKKSKLFVYVFTKGNPKLKNTNFYGTNQVPVMSLQEIYKDLLQNATGEVLDFDAKTPMKELLCREMGISYTHFVTNNDKTKLFTQLEECIL